MSAPQFETAQYKDTQQKNACKRCGQRVSEAYYRIDNDMVCEQCAEKAKLELPKDSHAAFTRALLFGAGGAVAGLAVYAGFAIATGIVIGYAALAVGYIIAKAMKLGSAGMGGRRYQIAAVFLTYAAVSMAAIPIDIHYAINHRDSAQAVTQPSQMAAGTDASAAPSGAQPGSPNWGALIGTLVLAGLASPFLELQQNPTSGLIGLVILYVGIQIAWKMMAGNQSQIIGPFRASPAAPGAPLSSA